MGKLSGINSSWLPLLPAERRDPSLFLEQPDLSLDLLLRLSGINSSWLPLLPAERKDPFLFPVQFPDLFLDLLLKPSGINRSLLPLLPKDSWLNWLAGRRGLFQFLEPSLDLHLALLLRLSGMLLNLNTSVNLFTVFSQNIWALCNCLTYRKYKRLV